MRVSNGLNPDQDRQYDGFKLFAKVIRKTKVATRSYMYASEHSNEPAHSGSFFQSL